METAHIQANTWRETGSSDGTVRKGFSDDASHVEELKIIKRANKENTVTVLVAASVIDCGV
jgi:hypothetical protein